MIESFDIVLASLLGAAGLAFLFLAVRAGRFARRLGREPTTDLGALRPGPVETVGTVHATEPPLTTYDGSPAVVVRRVMGYTRRSGSKTSRVTHAFATVESVSAELRDGAGGSCVLDLGAHLLLASRGEWFSDAESFAREHPELWRRFSEGRRTSAITDVHVREEWLPDGARCLVSATATPYDVAASDGDYRAVRQRLRLHGAPGRAMLVAAGPEDEMRAQFRRPVVALAVAGMVGLFAAALFTALVGMLDRLV